MRVAVIGTGIMGAPMARNIAAAGHEVTVWNRTREKAEALGLPVAGSPREAVDGAGAVVTMLADGDAVLAAMDGVALGADQVWWQASTVGVAATRRLHELAGGAAYVDAPVLGTRQPAEEGKLTILASGPAAARERVAPLFEATGARTLDLGEKVGDGTRMKLVLNAWLLALTEGLAESIALAEGLGVDPRRFLQILDGAPMGSPYAQLKGAMMLDRSYAPSFTLELAAKDAGLAAAAAEEAGIELPLPATVRAQMEKAIAAGHGDDDMAATIEAARK